MTDNGVLDEALTRLHTAGPEREDWLSNHGPMAVEALVRHGHGDIVHRWLDYYRGKLEDMPSAGDPITDADWREALGDPRRIGDWTAYFVRETAERPWRDVLASWWPRLLPGIAAGATHPVIRVGHAVRALLADEAAGGGAAPGTGPHARAAELAHGLGYWAARTVPTPGVASPGGGADPAEALEGVPRVPDQRGGYLDRLTQLGGTPGWSAATAALRPAATPDEARDRLAALVRAATHRYAGHAHHNAIMLVHSATAPNAVLRTLPALPRELWAPSLDAAWAAGAAVTAMYAGAVPVPDGDLPRAPSGPIADAADELFARAAANGDEHVVKFADTALDVAATTGDDRALVSAVRACELIPPVL